MSTTVSYKGQTLTTVSNDTKTLLTEGKYLEDDLTLTDVSGSGATLITKNISENGTYNASSDSADGYSQVTVAVPASAVDTGTKSISTNGTHDVTGYASANVNVPNSYSQSDEGKVVSNGALVAQTAHADVTPTTSDQTIDTTTNNSIKVKGDADLVASNIKKDVEIFGVTGSYEGGGGGVSVQDLAKNTAPTGVVVLDTNITTIGNFAFAGKPIAGIYGPNVTTINTYAFHSCSSLVKAKFPVITWLGNNNWYQFQSSGLQQASFPRLTENLPQNIMQGCTQLTTLDLGKCSSIQTKATAWSTNFNTIILRKTDALTTLANVDGIATGTKFANGGAGGTIYIPTVLYDHLGDGSSLDYQSATNWATVHGYGTITWEKLEGSIYESEDWLTI